MLIVFIFCTAGFLVMLCVVVDLAEERVNGNVALLSFTLPAITYWVVGSAK